MKQIVVAPDGMRWTVRRLIVPTGMRPLSRTEILDAAAPRRTVVDGMSRQVPDAIGAPTGPLPLAFLLVPLALPLVPFALLLRRRRVLPWTIEARTYPWGRRYPPIVLTYAVRGGDETRRAFGQLVEALSAVTVRRSSTARRASARHASRTAVRASSARAGLSSSASRSVACARERARRYAGPLVELEDRECGSSGQP